jgi:hypothetical protein
MDSLVDLFTSEIVHAFLQLLADADMLHHIRCETIEEGKEGYFIVISEYLTGNDYIDHTIDDVIYSLKFNKARPNGIIGQLDYYKLRDIAYDYVAIKPKRDLVVELTNQQKQLHDRVNELLIEGQASLVMQHELQDLKRALKTKEQIESIYGHVDIEDMMLKVNVLVEALLVSGQEQESDKLTELVAAVDIEFEEEEEVLVESKTIPFPSTDEEDDSDAYEDASLLDEDEEEDDEDPDASQQEQAEQEEEEEEEDETRLVDQLDDMDRSELKAYIRDNDLSSEVRVKKSMDDDAIRDAILLATEPDEEDDEDDYIEDDDITASGDDDLEMLDEEDGLEDYLSTKTPPSDDVIKSLEDIPNAVVTVQPTDDGSQYREQVVDFMALMKTTNPSIMIPSNKKAIRKACLTISKIVNVDGIEVDTLFEALTWGIQDDFWKGQMISLAAIRKESASNGNKKYANIMNAYYAALEKATSPSIKDKDIDDTDHFEQIER